MPNAPKSLMSPEEHYFRKQLNIEVTKTQLNQLNNKLPSPLKWSTVVADLHQENTPKETPNVKYVSADGHFEVVYSSNGKLLSEKNDPANMGTYNYKSPINDQANHLLWDVAPYYDYKNTEMQYKEWQKEFRGKSKEIEDQFEKSKDILNAPNIR